MLTHKCLISSFRSIQLNITELRQITLDLDLDSSEGSTGGEGREQESEQAACDVEFTRITSRCKNWPVLAQDIPLHSPVDARNMLVTRDHVEF